MQARLAQVVYTLTQFPTVKGVRFSLDGEPIDVLGGEGVVIDHPLARRDYADLLPVILVTSPTLNQTVRSPVLIRGSANVFEANVGIQILDADGEIIAETFTTATCGTGCRGTFRIRVPYEVHRGAGRRRHDRRPRRRRGRHQAPSRTRSASRCACSHDALRERGRPTGVEAHAPPFLRP